MTPRAEGRTTPVAVFGATGLVGQHLIRMLARHPWFRLAEVVASPARAGVRLADAVRWTAGAEIPREAADLRLLPPGEPLTSPVVLSALPASAAHCREPELALRGHRVSSNASAHRMDPGIPLLIPEVNGSDVALVDTQPWAEWGGSLVTNPDAVVAGALPALALIHRTWGIEGAAITTPEALAGEEERIAAEVRRFLGASVRVDVAVNRDPALHGHLAHVSLRLAHRAEPGEVAELLRAPAEPSRAGALPTAARIRRAAGHDVALAILSHNLVRGAAGACLANAELVELHRQAAPQAV